MVVTVEKVEVFIVREKNSARVEFVVKDYDKLPIPVERINTITMTIVNDSGSVIGSADRNIKDNVDSSGKAIVILSDTDNVIVSGNKQFTEVHRLIINVVTNDVTPIVIRQEIRLNVNSIQTIA